MNSKPVSLSDIHRSVRCLPYSPSDAEAVKVYLAGAAKNGLDVEVDASDLREIMNEGLLLLQSRDLSADFAFVNVDAGRGLFGGQKTNVMTYTADLYQSEFYPGPVLSSLLRALVGINNLYRSAGLLRGTGI